MHKRKPQNKDKHARAKKRIQLFLEQIEWLFDYQNWDREIVYKKDVKDTGHGRLAAEVKQDSDYRRVSLFIYPGFFDHTPKEQREFLLHEFTHTFTTRLYAAAIDLSNGTLHTPEQLRKLNEEATSRITNVIHGLLDGRKTYAKEAYAKYLK